ncbi:PQQ-binding-like beta-propeller repeat protein [Candidatus Poribacteria bacterium]|nr:PQQ-binding-like beta-propeller repeat protein [Candidatus Poribacteria bacterium]
MMNKTNIDPDTWYSLYRIFLAVAVIAGTFSLIVSLLLTVNYIAGKQGDPLDSERLLELKEELLRNPNNEVLKEDIRKLDLRLRKEYFRRRRFTRIGAYMLIFGIAIFLGSMLPVMKYRKNPPMPDSPKTSQKAEASRTRQLVIGIGSFIAGFAIAIAVIDRPNNYEIPQQQPVADITASEEKIEIQEIPATQVTEGSPAETQGTQETQVETTKSYPTEEELKKNWPRFRGPGGLGISQYTNIPEMWDGTTGEGILWKSSIRLPGKNSPVIWGNRVFVTGANETERAVYCFDAGSGELLWEKPVVVAMADPEPPEVSDDTGFAAPTPVTDGRWVFAMFANGDIICFDFDGNEIWSRNVGPFDSMYGYASSLLMYKDLLIVLLDQGGAEDGMSEIIALEAATGKSVWGTDRPVPNSWATPIIIDTGEREEIITCGSPWVIAYDPATGAELWRADCLGGDIAPSPVYANGLVYVTNTYETLAAIRPGGEGDVTETHIVWEAEDGLPDICSPLTNGELVFLLETYGLMTCYDAKDGTKVWEEDTVETFNTSPSLVGDKIYLITVDGITIIVEAGRQFKEVVRNELSEGVLTCPGFVDGRMYVRGEENLYCIGEK